MVDHVGIATNAAAFYTPSSAATVPRKVANASRCLLFDPSVDFVKNIRAAFAALIFLVEQPHS